MNASSAESNSSSSNKINRRRFLAGSGAAALGFTILKPQLLRGAEANRKLTLGIIGCGNRGQWITKLFADHGGYNLTAAADYFQDRVDELGNKFNVPATRRFTGLSGYKHLLEQKLDAVVIESPPYFHPEQAAAAVEAGKHVYLAKPIAVDVPGCRTVEATAKKASANKLCFLVDFQTRAHPSYQEAVKRVHDGMIGKIVSVDACYHSGPTWRHMDRMLQRDPKNPELRLRAWGLDRKLSGDVITEQNIHVIDVATWLLDAAPSKAYGTGGVARDLLGDCWDHFQVLYHFPNNIVASFSSTQVGVGLDEIQCRARGTEGTADTHYFGEVIVRAQDDIYNGGRLANLYTDGVNNNIAAFYDSITKENFANSTVPPSVRSTLTAILGRMAAYKGGEVTWGRMLSASEPWRADLTGLKA